METKEKVIHIPTLKLNLSVRMLMLTVHDNERTLIEEIDLTTSTDNQRKCVINTWQTIVCAVNTHEELVKELKEEFNCCPPISSRGRRLAALIERAESR